ncbi:MAG: hypothetical protein VX286_05205 [Bacteroidota bacterium]|nr:hypothetical protein [Bacteroidota bacterium]
MKHLLTAIACCLAVAGSAQTEWPWNPDVDSDNIIGVEDLMSLLTVFGGEFILDAPPSQTYTLALADAGNMNQIDCMAHCRILGGRISRTEDIAVFKDTIFSIYEAQYQLGEHGEEFRVWIDPYERNIGYGTTFSSCFASNCGYNDPEYGEWLFRNVSYPSSFHCFCAGIVLNNVD